MNVAARSSARVATLIYLACSLLFVTVYWWDRYETYEYGWEVGNIASALVSGRGFSDAFGLGTGPTSWFPPLYVVAQAAVFALFGNRTISSYWALQVLNVLLMTAAFYFLCRINFARQLNQFKLLLLPIFGLLSVFVFMKDFETYSLTVLLAILLVYVFSDTLEHGFHRTRHLFYLLAISLPFSNISFLLGFAMLLTLNIGSWLLERPYRIPIGHSVALMTILGLCVVIWGARNQYVLGRFIPNKSNLWFEFHLSNVTDRDGIIKQSTWLVSHPFANPSTRSLYTQLGEVTFVNRYQKPSHDYLSNHWDDYVVKVIRRAAHSFVFVTSSADIIEVDATSVSSSDLDTLREHGFIHENAWVNMDMSPSQFAEAVAKLDLISSAGVRADWEEKRRMVNRNLYWSPKSIAGGIALSGLPSLAMIACFALKPLRTNRVFRLSTFFFFLSIGPYILISHYARYQTFQVGFFAIFIFLPIAFLLNRVVNAESFTVYPSR